MVTDRLDDWDCVVTVKSLPALHHSVDFSNPLGSKIPAWSLEDI